MGTSKQISWEEYYRHEARSRQCVIYNEFLTLLSKVEDLTERITLLETQNSQLEDQINQLHEGNDALVHSINHIDMCYERMM